MRQSRDGEQRLFSQFGLFSLVFILLSSTIWATSFEDFKRTQTQSFSSYKDKRDSAFKNYLKQSWYEYQQQTPNSLYKKPKPIKIDSTKAHHAKSIGPVIDIIDKKNIKDNFVLKTKRIKGGVVFDFFGSEVSFGIDNDFKSARFYPQNKEGIVNFFNTAASSRYENIVSDIQKLSKKMQLNDWGIYQLVIKLSKKIYTNKNDANLFSWFIFNKLGYAVKIGLLKNNTVLMFYSKKTIYETPSYTFLNKKYYVVSNYAKGRLGSLYSYEQNYPDAQKELDLSMKRVPKFALNLKQKELSFTEYAKSYKVNFKYNQNLIDFMSTYPQADYKTYFNAPLDEVTYYSMLEDLKKYVDGKKATDAINFILHFVQKAFKYERDKQQFSREKVMFAQETLYFNRSDCEDRAILFANLIKRMFNIGVVGIKYKDHMATALYIPIGGDSVKIAKRKLIIADPTYVNSNIGQSMKKYRNIKPDNFIILN